MSKVLLTRRDVLRAGLVTSAMSLLGRTAHARLTSRPSFSFVLLGDLHFDRLEHHDMDWMRAEKPRDIRQVERYSQITAEVLPRLLAEVRAQVEAHNAPFVIQVGDLVEGLCGTPELAERHCNECLEMVESANLGAPLLITKGNHDITGPGSKEAYRSILQPGASAGLAKPETNHGTYVNDHLGSRFIFLDIYEQDGFLPAIDALKGRNPSESTFLIMHQPAIPYSARCWHAYRRESDSPRRETLLNAASNAGAIVLTGHLHKVSSLRCVQPEQFTQLAVVSVIPDPDTEGSQFLEGPDAYGPGLTETEPRFSPDTLAERQAVLTTESERVRDFIFADLPGYAVVHVDGSRVRADLYRGLGRRKWRSVSLT